jgi:hypothetical protein
LYKAIILISHGLVSDTVTNIEVMAPSKGNTGFQEPEVLNTVTLGLLVEEK